LRLIDKTARDNRHNVVVARLSIPGILSTPGTQR
jgi:hypothetical protein